MNVYLWIISSEDRSGMPPVTKQLEAAGFHRQVFHLRHDDFVPVAFQVLAQKHRENRPLAIMKSPRGLTARKNRWQPTPHPPRMFFSESNAATAFLRSPGLSLLQPSSNRLRGTLDCAREGDTFEDDHSRHHGGARAGPEPADR